MMMMIISKSFIRDLKVTLIIKVMIKKSFDFLDSAK